MNRVVVTGMGAITPVGNDVDTFWNSSKQGTVGIGPITSFDTADYKSKAGGRGEGFRPEAVYGSQGCQKNGAVLPAGCGRVKAGLRGCGN